MWKIAANVSKEELEKYGFAEDPWGQMRYTIDEYADIHKWCEIYDDHSFRVCCYSEDGGATDIPLDWLERLIAAKIVVAADDAEKRSEIK